jgi:hypothetical protein
MALRNFENPWIESMLHKTERQVQCLLNSMPFLQVWQEFWITGDCNGRGVPPSDPNWPLDHDLFLTCAYDTVKLLRNHASLALWCGGNEQIPPDDINEALTRQLALVPANENPSRSLDGTRLYLEGKRILHVLSVLIGVIFVLKSNNIDQQRQVGLSWLLSMIGYLYLSGVWLGIALRTVTKNTYV